MAQINKGYILTQANMITRRDCNKTAALIQIQTGKCKEYACYTEAEKEQVIYAVIVELNKLLEEVYAFESTAADDVQKINLLRKTGALKSCALKIKKLITELNRGKLRGSLKEIMFQVIAELEETVYILFFYMELIPR